LPRGELVTENREVQVYERLEQRGGIDFFYDTVMLKTYDIY